MKTLLYIPLLLLTLAAGAQNKIVVKAGGKTDSLSATRLQGIVPAANIATGTATPNSVPTGAGIWKKTMLFALTNPQAGQILSLQNDSTAVNIPIPNTGTKIAGADSVWVGADNRMRYKATANSVIYTLANTTDSIKPPGATVLAYYSFAGAAQNISVANDAVFKFSPSQGFTVAFWLRLNATSAVGRLSFSTASARIWDINCYYNGSAYQADGNMSDPSGSYKYSYIIPPAGITPGTWHYVTMVHNGNGNIAMYVNAGTNGQGVANSGTVTALATGGTFTLGRIAGLNSTGADVDDVVIANIALTPAQVTSLYNNGAPTPDTHSWYPANGLAYWKFNSNLNDEKGGHTGTATTPIYTNQ